MNNPTTVAEFMAHYYRTQMTRKANEQRPPAIVRLSINTILELYVPAEYKVFAAAGVDLTQPINYDKSRPWAEALGQPLTDVGIEVSANFDKKIISLSVGKTSLSDLIERYVPVDYEVYAEEYVDLDTRVVYDRSLPWPEALGKAASSVGIEMAANLDRKLVSLKQARRPKRAVVRPLGTKATQTAPLNSEATNETSSRLMVDLSNNA